MEEPLLSHLWHWWQKQRKVTNIYQSVLGQPLGYFVVKFSEVGRTGVSEHTHMAWVRDRLPLSFLNKSSWNRHSHTTMCMHMLCRLGNDSFLSQCCWKMYSFFFRSKNRNHIFPKLEPCHNSQHRTRGKRGGCGLQYLLTLVTLPFSHSSSLKHVPVIKSLKQHCQIPSSNILMKRIIQKKKIQLCLEHCYMLVNSSWVLELSSVLLL